jgi:hypothetical protein
MLENLIHHLKSPESKAHQELTEINKAVDTVMESVALQTRKNFCISELDQIGKRIEDFGRDHLAHLKDPAVADLLYSKYLIAKAVNEFDPDVYAQALTTADRGDQRGKIFGWANELERSYPMIAQAISSLGVAAEEKLRQKDL